MLRRLFWIVVALVAVAAAVYLTGNLELLDRLTELFWSLQLSFPANFNAEQFLIILAMVSMLAVLLVVSGAVALVGFMASRVAVSGQRGTSEIVAAKQEVHHVQQQYAHQYEDLVSLAQALTKRLDKRVLIQAMLEAASRITSNVHTNSLASLWLLNLETDTFLFEMGHYCDENLFIKTDFQPTELPFGRVVTSQRPWILPAWNPEIPFVKPEKIAQLGSATSSLIIPLIMESRVQGVLVLFCHPDIVKGYEEQKAFYSAEWELLTLTGIIAIQGAVTILDRLTAVHTRDYFMTRLTQEIDRANRYQLPLSLLMIDIDNFKLVNDTLGHPQGDAVLKIIAKVLRKEVRAIDLVGRYGGEEFIIMLPETGYGDDASASGALVVAERIRRAVDEEFHDLQKPLNLTISIGVSVRRLPEQRDLGYQELVRLADEQLYRAKTTGKNKVCVVLPDHPQAVT